METEGNEPPTEIMVPICLKPEEGLEVWRLWVKRKNAELNKQEKTKLAPIGRKLTNIYSNTSLFPGFSLNTNLQFPMEILRFVLTPNVFCCYCS